MKLKCSRDVNEIVWSLRELFFFFLDLLSDLLNQFQLSFCSIFAECTLWFLSPLLCNDVTRITMIPKQEFSLSLDWVFSNLHYYGVIDHRSEINYKFSRKGAENPFKLNNRKLYNSFCVNNGTISICFGEYCNLTFPLVFSQWFALCFQN